MAKRKVGPPRRTRTEGVPATRYIESSALVAALLEGDSAARVSIRALGQRVTSALTLAETTLVPLRAGETLRWQLATNC